MSTVTNLSRFEVLEYLGVDETQFQTLLSRTGIVDSESFPQDQVSVLEAAKRSSGGVARSRGVSSPMGESQSATSFESVLEAQAQLMRQQAEAALDNYNNQVGEVFQYVLDEARGIQTHWAGEFQRSLREGAIDTQAIVTEERISLPGA
jgi:hypothetical protein